MIVQATNDIVACYGIAKCAEIILERRKIVKGEGLKVLNERMKTMDPDENQICKFRFVQQADDINVKEVYIRVKEEISRKMNIITRTELSCKNLVKTTKTKVMHVCPMNVCKSIRSEQTEL